MTHPGVRRPLHLDELDLGVSSTRAPGLDREVGVLGVGLRRRMRRALVGGGQLLQTVDGRVERDAADAVGSLPAVDGQVLIGGPVDVEHRHGLRRTAVVLLERARLHTDGDDLVGELAGESVGEDAAVRVAGREDASRIDRVLRAELFDEQPDEGDVIDVLARGRAATSHAVPGAQGGAVRPDADAVGIHHDEPVGFGEPVESRVVLELGAPPHAAMQRSCRRWPTRAPEANSG